MVDVNYLYKNTFTKTLRLMFIIEFLGTAD